MIELSDVQRGYLGMAPGQRKGVTTQELLDEMGRLRIARAVVRLVPEALEVNFIYGNERIYDACRPNPALIPCPVVAARNGVEGADDGAQVEAAVQAGAGAVWIRPEKDRWSLAAWCSDPLFRALEARRLPVICLERCVGFDAVAQLAERYPHLPLIAAEVNYRSQHILLALLRRYPHVYLSTGNNNCVHRGLEQFVRLVGAERLLFGTGFPGSEPMAAITQLMYAEIGDADKRLIGSENLRRLMEAIQR
jgi:hypothetical protein